MARTLIQLGECRAAEEGWEHGEVGRRVKGREEEGNEGRGFKRKVGEWMLAPLN